MIEDGVDSVISNYPERVGWVAGDMGLKSGKKGVKVPQKCMAGAKGAVGKVKA